MFVRRSASATCARRFHAGALARSSIRRQPAWPDEATSSNAIPPPTQATLERGGRAPLVHGNDRSRCTVDVRTIVPWTTPTARPERMAVAGGGRRGRTCGCGADQKRPAPIRLFHLDTWTMWPPFRRVCDHKGLIPLPNSTPTQPHTGANRAPSLSNPGAGVVWGFGGGIGQQQRSRPTRHPHPTRHAPILLACRQDRRAWRPLPNPNPTATVRR